MLRFSLLVYLVGCLTPSFACCDVFEVLRLGDYVEFWVRCCGVREALHLLEQVSSWGSVLALGGLKGLARKSLPATQEEFVEFASSYVVLSEGSEITAEILGPWSKAISFLVNVSSRLQIDLKSKSVKASLTRPVSTTSFFDARLRILKPLEIPPKLTKNHKHL